ncbi:MAG: phosphatidylserine decarboxylase [Candidatus Riflebacteria bacterium]|nr:phosphatidylserine decarboxylase [Candidatus Riflebacteria bacterium]
MNETGSYLDRETGRVVAEPIVAGSSFTWLYRSSIGRVLGRFLFRSRRLHGLVERLADLSWSRWLVPWFVRSARVNVAECERPPGTWRTLNELFTRRLAPGSRPIDPDPAALVAPGDGKLTVTPRLDRAATLCVKSCTVPLAELADDQELPARFAGGSAAVLRLYLGDYHRLHFPADGVPSRPRPVPGHYYSVTPFPGNDANYPLVNSRTVTRFATDRFGELCLVDVGGFLVAGIHATFVPGERVVKGQEKSFFAFGGSTLVILAEPGRLHWDKDLVEASAAGLEVAVKMGTRVALGV